MSTETEQETSLLIGVLGATGKVGKQFVRLALEQGHAVRALARDAGRLEPSSHPRLDAVVGDANKAVDAAAVVAGVDVLVSCLGNVAGSRIMSASFEHILAAAAARTTVPRCVFITTIGCGGTSWLVKQLLSLIGRRAAFQDYEAADERVRNESSVPCVLVRPAALTDKPGRGTYRATERTNGTFAKPIPRADVARFLVDAVTDTRWDRKAVQLSGR